MTREEFGEWRAHPATQAFYQELSEAASDTLAKVMNRTTPDPSMDQFLKGMFKAFDEMAAWKPKFEDDTEGENEDA